MTMSEPPIILVLGPQGSGKGTQVARLSVAFHIPSVAAGDLFRQAAEQPTDVGRRAKAVLDGGRLMPIELWEPVVGAYLDRANLSQGYILDGVVRSLEQVDRFERILRSRALPQPWVVSIELDDETATQRLLKRGRVDDTEQRIRERLRWSREEAQPAIDHYRARGRLVVVDGDQSRDKVYANAVSGLTKLGAFKELQ